MSAACPEKAVDDVVRSALDCCELWAPSHVERFSVEELSPFKFCRDFVAASRPVVFTGRLDATSTDRNEDWLGLFKEAVGESLLTVSCTPDGRADSLQEMEKGRRFAQPLLQEMKLADLSWR